MPSRSNKRRHPIAAMLLVMLMLCACQAPAAPPLPSEGETGSFLFNCVTDAGEFCYLLTKEDGRLILTEQGTQITYRIEGESLTLSPGATEIPLPLTALPALPGALCRIEPLDETALVECKKQGGAYLARFVCDAGEVTWSFA